jgi:peptidylprolyl isomerase
MLLWPPATALAQSGKPQALAQQGARPQTPARPAAPAASAPPASAAAPSAAPVTSSEPSANDSEPVARAGATTITLNDVRGYVNMMNPKERAVLARDPRLLSQVVRSMLANQLVLKDALAKKWDQEPAVAAQLDHIRQDAIIETYLRSVSAPPANFPSNADIENAYEINKTAFLAARQFQLAQIVVAAPQGANKDAEEKARKKLESIQRKLKGPGADFAAIAASDSDERDSAGQGGDLGWLPENQLKPEIRTQVIGLATGAVSDPVRLDDGWHILTLRDTRPASTKPLEEVRDLLVQRLREERSAANRRAFVAKLLEHTPPAINELSLAKVLGDANQKASSK